MRASRWRRFWDWLLWDRVMPKDVPMSCHCWQVIEAPDGTHYEQPATHHHHPLCPVATRVADGPEKYHVVMGTELDRRF